MKKKLLVGALSTALLLPTAADAAYKSYVGYVLPALQGNNYTGYHTKETNDDYIVNIVENLEGTSTANFWAEDHNGSISSKYNQKVGNATRINFNTNKSAGNQIRMGMENAEFSFSNAFVAGRVDFR